MLLIPNKPYPGTKSKAELRIFAKLQECFSNEEGYIAFHSLNLTAHKTKRFGEADFVIVSPSGFFVLEVKGGGIKFENGRWSIIINSDNETKQLYESPFRQAETAMHAIKTKIKESDQCKHLRYKICMGYGVIFPDIEWEVSSSEWNRHTICDLKNFRNFEHDIFTEEEYIIFSILFSIRDKFNSIPCK